MTRVAIVGAGHVGLVTGVCLAECGHQVACVDLDAGKVASINRAESPIHEPGLAALLGRHAGRGFRATTSLAEAVRGAELTLIAVGTPFADGRVDLGPVTRASEGIGAALSGSERYHVVAVKSTVPPGTTEEVVGPAVERASGRKAGAGFGLAMNPEFSTEGQAVDDFLRPDRLVIGGIDDRTRDSVAALYAGLPEVPVIRTTPRTAELIKYASNAMLATAISFSNELADLCVALGGIDIAEVMHGVHLSGYLSPRLEDGRRVRAPLASFYEAGCGFGGSCLPKDVNALAALGVAHGRPLRMLEAVLAVNAGRSGEVLRLLRRHIPDLNGARVAVLGLAFKPGTDDIRESPGLRIAALLAAQGASVIGYDPVATPPGTGMRLASSLAEAVSEADAIVIAAGWKEFRVLPELLRGRTPPPLVVDGRRLLVPGSIERYEGIGRGQGS